MIDLRTTLLGTVMLLTACQPLQRPADPFFEYDFETDADLDRISWDCGQLFARDSLFVTSGEWGLRLAFLQGENLGLKFNGIFADWSRFRALVFDAYNPQPEAVMMMMHVGLYREGEFVLVSRPVRIPPGKSRKRLSLDSLRYAEDGSPADLSLVLSARLIIEKPQRGTTLYFDFFRLE